MNGKMKSSIIVTIIIQNPKIPHHSSFLGSPPHHAFAIFHFVTKNQPQVLSMLQTIMGDCTKLIDITRKSEADDQADYEALCHKYLSRTM